MSRITIGIKSLTGSDELSRAFSRSLTDHVRNTILYKIPLLREEVREIVRSAIVASPEYSSLLNGELREEFGLSDPADDLEAIISYIEDNIIIEYLPADLTFLGGVEVAILKEDMTDLYSRFGSYVSLSRRGATSKIPWLEWLLTEGTRIIITDYRIDKSMERSYSRTGSAVMVQGDEGWGVPYEFAGTDNDNWLTRTLESVYNVLDQTIRQSILNEL